MVTVSQGPIWGMASSSGRPPTTTSKSSKLASREPGCARLCELLFGGRDKIGSIVDYLRYMAATASDTSVLGNAIQGKAVFQGKGGCFTCHRVRDRGSRVGPDLTEIGSVRRLIELQRSILDPDAEVLPENRFVPEVEAAGVLLRRQIANALLQRQAQC